jgi:drug/metabolite transporter (DMT)-like permease
VDMQRTIEGWGSGLLGVIIFSGSLPATRIGVGGLSPLFLTSARAVIAAILGAGLLLLLQQKRPAREDILSLTIVASGVVIGFPLLTGFTLQHITSAHSVVFIGILPLSTAIFGVLRGGERPKLAFWLFSAVGSLAVASFALTQSRSASLLGDLLMLAAILLCGLGYAEGATLSRRLGGWQVISWALLLALPVMLVFALASSPHTFSGIGWPVWLSLAYVSVFSMFVGFFFWYRGLAIGGIAGSANCSFYNRFLACCSRACCYTSLLLEA